MTNPAIHSQPATTEPPRTGRRSIFENYERPGPEEQPEAELELAEGRNAALPPCPSAGLQCSINVAVGRCFLYRFLGKALEDPDAESWAALCDFGFQSSLKAAVRAVTGDRPSALDAAMTQVLRDITFEGYPAFADGYLTCFGHTVRGDCPMNEIEYGDIKADPLFQPHRLADLGGFYAAFGLELATGAAQRHDHISIELEFMSVLAAKEAYALEHQLDDEQSCLIRDAQKKFLREHLGRWSPAFARRLARMAQGTCLGALGDLMREFILGDCVRFGVPAGSEDLNLRPIDESMETLCATCGLDRPPPGASPGPIGG